MAAPEGCVVSGALGVFLRVSRMAGLAPLTFIREQDGWRVTRSRALRIYGNVLITIIAILSIITTMLDIIAKPQESVYISTLTDRYVWSLNRSSMILISSMSVYGSWDQMGMMMSSLNTVQKTNHGLLKNIQTTSSERNMTISIVSFLAVTLVLHVVVIIELVVSPPHISSSYWLRLMDIFCFLLTGMLILQILQFHLIVYNVSKTFMVINDSMRILLQESNNKPNNIPSFDNVCLTRIIQTPSPNNIFGVTVINCISGGPTVSFKSHHEIVHDLSLAYIKACEVMRNVEQFYEKIIILLLGYFLAILTLSFYQVITAVYDVMAQDNLISFHLGLYLIWCINHLVNVFLLIEPCHLTHVEMEVTRSLVSHLIRYTRSKHDPLAVELEKFYKLLILDQTKYSPMKVTTLSRSLVITILSSITTYLVILLQDK